MKTSTAIAGRNLYITTKGLVLLHQGICYCHTVQLPSSCNCCISMHSWMHCKTTRILAVGFLIRSYCFTQRNQNLHPYNFLRRVFARGAKEHTSPFMCAFQTLQSVHLDSYWEEFKGWKRGGKLGFQSHTAAQGQWVRSTQPEHTCRAGRIVQLTVIVPLWSPQENMFPDNEDWLHGPDSNHDLDWLHRRGEMRRKPPVMVQVTISIGADISRSQQMLTD